MTFPGTAADFQSDEVRLLIEVGMYAAGLGDVHRADRIFAGVRACGSAGIAHILGPALARMNANQAPAAVSLLNVSGTSDDESLVAWRSVALFMSSRPGEARRLALTVASGSSPSAHMARALCNGSTSGLLPGSKP